MDKSYFNCWANKRSYALMKNYNYKTELYKSTRHKTNANYENLVCDKVEKRVTKNLLCDSCLTIELD